MQSHVSTKIGHMSVLSFFSSSAVGLELYTSPFYIQLFLGTVSHFLRLKYFFHRHFDRHNRSL